MAETLELRAARTIAEARAELDSVVAIVESAETLAAMVAEAAEAVRTAREGLARARGVREAWDSSHAVARDRLASAAASEARAADMVAEYLAARDMSRADHARDMVAKCKAAVAVAEAEADSQFRRLGAAAVRERIAAVRSNAADRFAECAEAAHAEAAHADAAECLARARLEWRAVAVAEARTVGNMSAESELAQTFGAAWEYRPTGTDWRTASHAADVAASLRGLAIAADVLAHAASTSPMARARFEAVESLARDAANAAEWIRHEYRAESRAAFAMAANHLTAARDMADAD